MAKTCVGFDIGTHAMKIAVCSGGRVERTIVEELPENLVKNGAIVSEEALAETIREMSRRHRLGRHACAMLLPDSTVFFRRLTMPAMTVDQLKINLPYEFRDFITQEKDKYFYDYAICGMTEDGASGKPAELDLMAAATLKETIAHLSAMFRRAGFKLTAAAPRECAYSNLIRTYEAARGIAPGEEYCLLDLGHAETRIHIFSGPHFEATRLMEHSCGLLDHAIAEACSVDPHIARAYKESNHNNVLYGDGTMNIYNNIAIEIMKAINFYSFNNPDSTLSRVYLCGGGAEIQPLIEAIGRTIRLEIHHVDELLPQDVEHPAACAAAIGITMGQGRESH